MTGGEAIEVLRDVRPGVIVVQPDGDVDMACSPALRATLRDVQQGKPPHLVVNLDRVGYMDTAGLATLVEAMRTAKTYTGSVLLCGMNDKVRAIFEIAQLHQFFTIVESLDDALSYAGPA
jgi:anti-sigma B factor antagonist